MKQLIIRAPQWYHVLLRVYVYVRARGAFGGNILRVAQKRDFLLNAASDISRVKTRISHRIIFQCRCLIHGRIPIAYVISAFLHD